MISHVRVPRAALEAVEHLDLLASAAVLHFYSRVDRLAYQPLRGRRATQRGLAALMGLPASSKRMAESVLEALVEDGLAEVSTVDEARVITVHRVEALYLDPATRLPTLTPPAPVVADPATDPETDPALIQQKPAEEAPSQTEKSVTDPATDPGTDPATDPGPNYARVQPTTSTSYPTPQNSISSASENIPLSNKSRIIAPPMPIRRNALFTYT